VEIPANQFKIDIGGQGPPSTLAGQAKFIQADPD